MGELEARLLADERLASTSGEDGGVGRGAGSAKFSGPAVRPNATA